MNIQTLDRGLAVLQAHKQQWAELPIERKIALLCQVQQRLYDAVEVWVEVGARVRHTEPASPWVSEEWFAGPYAVGTAIGGYIQTLSALAAGRLPQIRRLRTRTNGQLVADVFPATLSDSLLFNGISVEVWMQAGVTAQNFGEHIGAFYRQKQPVGKVALVLGAGNLSSIPAMDILHRLYACGEVVLLKMNPVNAGVGPVIEQVFAPFIDAGYLRICYGGADVGAYLVEHAAIEAIHITGSARTHDAIVFGPGEAGAVRKHQGAPRLQKPISSELGGISPVIILPGSWSKADIAYQAEQVATMRLLNNGYTCVAGQLLITPKNWPQRTEFLDALRAVFRRAPSRAPYYPGSERRLRAVLEQHPHAERFSHDALRTIVSDLDPQDHDEICFREEFFAPILAEMPLPGADAASYLRAAVQFCNARLVGTLGVTILGHPATMCALGSTVEEAVAALRYGVVGVNEWHGAAFSLPQAPWGGYPGASLADVQSGIGVVHNSLLFDKPEKTVIRGSFYAFPRGVLHGDYALLPRQPWLIGNRTGHITARRVTAFAFDNNLAHLPGIFAAALRG